MVLRSEGGKCHLNVCIMVSTFNKCQLRFSSSQVSHKLSNVVVATELIFLPFETAVYSLSNKSVSTESRLVVVKQM